MLSESVNEPITDGRRAKGERRRQLLIAATVRVIQRDGASGVTHRTVAKEAGVPATAATYYFNSVDALLTAALISSLDADIERLSRLTNAADAGIDKRRALALLMSEAVLDSGRLLAEFELCLLAVRRPELRGSTRRWKAALADFAGTFTDNRWRIELFANAYDGLLLQALLADEPPTVDTLEILLRELLPDNE